MVAVSAGDAGFDGYSVADFDVFYGGSGFDDGTWSIRHLSLKRDGALVCLPEDSWPSTIGLVRTKSPIRPEVRKSVSLAHRNVPQPITLAHLSANNVPTTVRSAFKLLPDYFKMEHSHLSRRYPFAGSERGHHEDRGALELVVLRMQRP